MSSISLQTSTTSIMSGLPGAIVMASSVCAYRFGPNGCFTVGVNPTHGFIPGGIITDKHQKRWSANDDRVDAALCGNSKDRYDNEDVLT